MQIGISQDEFWRLNPHKIKIRLKAYEGLEEKKDAQMWHLGKYIYKAVVTAIDHTILGGNSDYFEKPILQMNESRELTEEEKQSQVNAFFAGLQVMQSNFEREHNKRGE